MRFLVFIILLGFTQSVQAGETVGINDAAFRGDIVQVRAMIDKDPALARFADSNGWTPLHAAADAGHTEIVFLLLSKKAAIDARTKSGWTPLMAAACNGYRETAGLLISKGARIDARDDKYGRTSLHWATIQGKDDVVVLLLSRGALASDRDKAKATPMDYARSYKRKSLESILSDKSKKS